MYKIAFFDYDNTLYSHASHSVPESTYVALEELQANGIKTCLCTGRCKYEIDNYFDLPRLKFDYYIYFNGQAILDNEFNIISSETMKGIDKENAIKLFKEKKIPIVLESKNDYYINFVNDQVYYTCTTCSSSPVPIVKDYIEDDLYMASIFPGDMPNFKEFMEENFPNCYTTKWTVGSYDILLKGRSKADAIKTLLEHLHIDAKDAIAFGDGQNDHEMMETVGLSIAMGNAEEEIKQVSTYTTADIDDDGIYKGLKHFKII